MAENKMQLEDWLDDLCVRFIIHLPKEDLSSVARICFQVEEAQWFYEDFIRPLDPTLPSMSLRSFCLRIFQHCPLLAPFSAENHMRAFEEFMQYKTRVPVRGAILLNEAMDSTVLVKGWKKGANWSFPRGKINKDEDDLDCAIREVYEETGFDLRQAGLVPKDDEVKYIQISMREQQIRLYIFRNVPMDTVFEPKTRKEISKVEWYKLSELPAFRKKGNSSHDNAAAASNANKFYMVAPFLVPLKKWVLQQKKKDASRAAASSSHQAIHPPAEEPLTEDDIGTHVEPVPGPSNGTPAIETMEGATRELQRLLKVQPPTQGLQMSPSSSTASKGEALMALLRKSAEPQQAPQQPHHPHSQTSNTAPDLAHTSGPGAHAPHHHGSTYGQPAPNYQPPSNFPVTPSSMQNTAPAYAGQDSAHAHDMSQTYGRNPFISSTQPQRSEPVLLHPQPLPPQVQQSVLTRGILPTPVLLDAVGQGGQHGQQNGQQSYQRGPHAPAGGQYNQPGAPSPYTVGANDSYATQQQTPKPAQLTDHAMALLNTFKYGTRDGGEHKAHGSAPQNPASVSVQQNQYHSASWANAASTTQASNPAAQLLPHPMPPVTAAGTSPRAIQPSDPQAGSRFPQPNDTHRSALLEMFKKAGPRSPLSNEIKMQPGSSQQSPGTTRHNDTGSPGYKATSAAELLASAPGANHTPGRTDSELNRPYRPVQILSRPKQGEHSNSQDFASAQAQIQRLQQRLSPMGSTWQDAGNTGRQGMSSPRDRAFSHYMEQEAKRSPQPNYAAAHAASLPYASQSPSSTHFASPFQQQQQFQQSIGMQQRRKDSNSEQKQKLLSLFSKGQQQQQQSQQASPTGFTVEAKGKGKETTVFEQPRSGSTPRSRVASFASAGANEPSGTGGSGQTSRRGSQTPISPADRNFLLSYLESVTNAGR